MRNVVNISNGDKILPFLVESSENRDYMVANRFHLVNCVETTKAIGEDTLVITDGPVNGSGVDLFYRQINNWQTGQFNIQVECADIESDRPATQE